MYSIILLEDGITIEKSIATYHRVSFALMIVSKHPFLEAK